MTYPHSVPIPGFPGYRATSAGRIVGKRGRVMGNGPARRGKYCLVRPWVDGVPVNKSTHVLVCLAFHGASPGPGYEVDHIDFDKGNNRPENLRWLTRSANLRHSRKPCPYSLARIRARLAAGDTGVSIALDFGLSPAMVSRIKNGSRWAGIV